MNTVEVKRMCFSGMLSSVCCYGKVCELDLGLRGLRSLRSLCSLCSLCSLHTGGQARQLPA